MVIAGITGTIGTGKSTVSRMFANLGAYVIDADEIAHQVIEKGRKAYTEVVKYFGVEILNGDESIDRQKLALIVFSDPAKLNKLNSIVHPEVLEEDLRLVKEKKQTSPNCVIIKDIPLLLENDIAVARSLVDKIIVVYSSPEIQLKRLLSRGMNQEDALKRIKSQIPVSEKTRFADFIINNDGTMEDTYNQVKEIYSKLLKLNN